MSNSKISLNRYNKKLLHLDMYFQISYEGNYLSFSATKVDSGILQTKEGFLDAVQPLKGHLSPAWAHCVSGRLPCGGESQLKLTLQEDIPSVNTVPLRMALEGDV